MTQEFADNDSIYSVRLVEEDVAGSIRWYAEHPELLGCNATGADPAAAVENLAKSRDAWLAVARELGREIPPPPDVATYTVVYLARNGTTRVRDKNIALGGEVLDREVGPVAA